MIALSGFVTEDTVKEVREILRGGSRLQEMAETNEEFAELVQQLGDCRDAEIKWASTVADDMTRLSDLRSLRRDLELEIRGLVGTEEPVEPSKGS